MKKVSSISALKKKQGAKVQFSFSYVDGKSDAFQIDKDLLINMSMSIQAMFPLTPYKGAAEQFTVASDGNGNALLTALLSGDKRLTVLFNENAAMNFATQLMTAVMRK